MIFLGLPIYLNRDLFEVAAINQFEYQMSTLVGGIRTKFDCTNLVVEFSDQIKRKKFGRYRTIDEVIRDLIRKYENARPRIEEIYKQHRDRLETVEDIEELKHHFADSLSGVCLSCDFDKNLKILDRIFRVCLPISSVVAGEYYLNQNKIVLYKQPIEDMARQSKTIEQAYTQIFLHELFHCYHYFEAKYAGNGELIHRKDYTATVIKESLAARFEWLYCYNLHLPNNLENTWQRINVVHYPYSGATFVQEPQRFEDIYNLSMNNEDEALRELLPQRLFWDVKNKK